MGGKCSCNFAIFMFISKYEFKNIKAIQVQVNIGTVRADTEHVQKALKKKTIQVDIPSRVKENRSLHNLDF